jgi:predicted nucleic acid-binding protein
VIAIDTSSLIAYLTGDEGSDVAAVDTALASHQACLPPVVLTELLSDHKLAKNIRALFQELPLLELTDGFWERAGTLRASVLARRHRAKLADTLIAQACIDHGVPLIARDEDFRHFTGAGLTLL